MDTVRIEALVFEIVRQFGMALQGGARISRQHCLRVVELGLRTPRRLVDQTHLRSVIHRLQLGSGAGRLFSVRLRLLPSVFKILDLQVSLFYHEP